MPSRGAVEEVSLNALKHMKGTAKMIKRRKKKKDDKIYK